MDIRNLLLGGAISGGIKVLSAGASFLMFLYLARVLGAAEFGHFATMFALGSTIGVVATLGQHTLSLKTLSTLENGPRDAEARRLVLRRGYGLVLLGSAACVALLLLLWWGDRATGLPLGGRYALGACLLVLPFAIANLVSHQYRALGSLSWSLLPREVLWRAAVVALCLGAAVAPWAFTDALRAMATVSALLLGIVLAQIGGLAILLRRANRHADTGLPETEIAALPRFSVWIWLAPVFAMGTSFAVVVATPFLPAEQIGAYFAAQKIAQLLQLPIIAINMVASPIFARLHARGKRAELQTVAGRVSLILCLPLGLGALAIMGFAPMLLGLFDPGFSVYAGALILLAAGWLFRGLCGPAYPMMLMTGGERHVVRLNAVFETLGILLIPVFIGLFGLIGVALVATAVRIASTLAAVFWCRRSLGVNPSITAWIGRGQNRD